MKRHSIFYLFISFCLPGISVGQSITMEEADNLCTNAGTMTLTFSSSMSGPPVRNIYEGHNNNGNGLLRVTWANNQWEIQWDTDGDDDPETLMYYSTYASRPNPPALSVGNWTEGGLGCGNLTQFSGTGTQTSLSLPVELIGFHALKQGSIARLDWQTASEHNNAGFYIERSAEGRKWQAIGFVEGSDDHTGIQHYSFQDEKPLSGGNYYRLRQTDFDGATEYSSIVRVDFKNSEEDPGLNVFPNPVSGGELNLFWAGSSESIVSAQWYNPIGQLLRSESIFSGNNVLNINDLPEGVYTIRVWDGARIFSKKVWVKPD